MTSMFSHLIPLAQPLSRFQQAFAIPNDRFCMQNTRAIF